MDGVLVKTKFVLCAICVLAVLSVAVRPGPGTAGAADPAKLGKGKGKVRAEARAGGRRGGAGKQDAETAPAATQPSAETLRRIRLLTDYYTREYGKHLASRDWFVRALAVIALGRIDHPKTTAKLQETLDKDTSMLVRLCAWETLHARSGSLSADEHRAWVAGGVEAAWRNAFVGDFRGSLLRAMVSYGPEGFDGKAKRLFLRYLDQVDHTNPLDSRTLTALREVVAAWRDPAIVRAVAAKMNSPQRRNQAEYVLGGLTDEIAAIGSIDAKLQPSSAEWGRARSAWLEWIREAKLTAPEPGSLKPYTGRSALVPPAEPLDDPRDPKWREDLELESLRVTDFDLAFVIDTTGSMLPPIQWVGRSVHGMMRVFSLVCREPRVGAVFYRHEVVPELQKPCCQKLKAQNKGPMFRTMYFGLTENPAPIAQKLLAINPRTGAYLHPGGAVHGGLLTALTKLQWKKTQGARKIMVLIGDSPVTPGNEAAAEKLAEAAHKRGFIIHAVTLKRLPSYEAVVAKGGGKTLLIPFNKANGRPGKGGGKGKGRGKGKGGKGKAARGPKAGPEPQPGPGVANGQIASPLRKDSPFNLLVGEIIRSMLPEGYHKRVDPLVNIVMEYAASAPSVRRGG